jgi:hypothetical protein
MERAKKSALPTLLKPRGSPCRNEGCLLSISAPAAGRPGAPPIHRALGGGHTQRSLESCSTANPLARADLLAERLSAVAEPRWLRAVDLALGAVLFPTGESQCRSDPDAPCTGPEACSTTNARPPGSPGPRLLLSISARQPTAGRPAARSPARRRSHTTNPEACSTTTSSAAWVSRPKGPLLSIALCQRPAVEGPSAADGSSKADRNADKGELGVRVIRGDFKIAESM